MTEGIEVYVLGSGTGNIGMYLNLTCQGHRHLVEGHFIISLEELYMCVSVYVRRYSFAYYTKTKTIYVYCYYTTATTTTTISTTITILKIDIGFDILSGHLASWDTRAR